jgi:pSer/pThr/pTyr-binding forkhead associated (FHA) protein
MHRVVITLEGQIVAEREIESGRVTIGRRQDNDIRLADPTVSREHACLVVGERVYLEDIGSRNGLLVRGRRVRRHEMQTGDAVMIGRYRLEYSHIVEEDEDPSVDAEKTQMLGYGSGSGETAGPVGVAKVFAGDGEGNVLDLRKPFTAVGKMGVHVAVITRRPDGYTIRTVTESGEPTKVNGHALEKETVQLEDGDVVDVAGMKIEFLILSGV